MDIQKIGFIGFGACFMAMGAICLVAGLVRDVTTLKWMGVWLPLGALQVAVVLWYYQRHENQRDDRAD